MSYYHGGPSGLARICPPCESGVVSTAEWGNYVTRPDRVYLCSDPNGALIYAAMHPADSVSVYTVEPVGELEPDPDCTEPGLSFMCYAAVVRYERKIGKALRRQCVAALMDDRRG